MKRTIAVLILIIGVCSQVWAGTTSTSGVTAQTIIDRARRDLNVPSTDPVFTDVQMIQWVNEAVWTTVNKTRCLESAVSDVVIAENQRRYAIVGDYLDVEVVEHDSGDTTDPLQVITLDRVHKNDIGHNKERGRPKIYCVWADNLEVWPIPRSTQSGTTLHVYKVAFPSGVTSVSSAIETPAYLDSAIVSYVVSKGFSKSGQDVQGKTHMAIYEARIKEFMINILRRTPVE